MHKDVRSEPSTPPSSGLIRLQAHASDLSSLIGPMWAALCGVAASGGFGWRGTDWLRVALVVLLADGGWGTIWAALGACDWASPLRRWRDWQENTPAAKLPYTRPGTVGARLSRLVGRLRAWWREVLWPACGHSLLAIAVAAPTTALVASLLGADLLLLSLAALALMQLGVLWEGGRGIIPPGWDALIAVALPWLAGHAAFGAVTLRSAGLSVLFALSWGRTWRVTSRWGRAITAGSQFVAIASLIAFRRPLAAATVFLLLVPQLALLPAIQLKHPAEWYVRQARPWLMTAMAVAALAL